MKKLLLALLLLAPAPALADSTWTITRNGTKVGEIVLTDAQQARVAQWAIAQRKGAIVQTPAVPAVAEVRNAEGVVTTPGVAAVPAVMRDPTAAEVVAFIADDFFTDLLGRATSWHRSEGARSGADAVAPVVKK